MSREVPHTRCKAKSKSSGKQCARLAIAGGAVCTYHGGAAPQVRRRAEERLAALVDPAIEILRRTMQRKEGKLPDRHALRAARDVLDRTGYDPRHRIELTGKDGGPITTAVDLTRLSDEQLRQLEDLAQAAAPAGKD